jgi:hypothetical protein
MAAHLEPIYSGDLLRNVRMYEIVSPALRLDTECPFDISLIQDAINHLPIKKAPGIDHLRNEML